MDVIRQRYAWIDSSRFSLRAALLYGLAGVLWILATDPLLGLFFPSGVLPLPLQLFKGVFFVLLSALVFYLALRAALRHLERYRREAQVQERRLSIHISNSPLAVIEWDSQGRVIEWSRRAEEIFGWRAGEVLGRFWSDLPLTHPEVPVQGPGQICRTVVSNRNFRKDNGVVHCEWYNSILTDAAGNVQSILSQVQDVTDRVKAEEERRQLETHIQHTQKLESLGILAGGIAHDFNNLLVGILGNADLALEDLPEDAPARHCLKELMVSAQHAADLCRQMLAYSGKGQFVVEPVNLNALLTDILHFLSASISKRARLHLDLYDALPAVEADATQLRQVFLNLIVNASDALGETDGEIRVSTRALRMEEATEGTEMFPTGLAAGEFACITVRDTGCGMDEQTQDRIFDPFFTTKFTGRGLGLAVVLGIVRGHGGQIEVKSVPGEGTAFTLYFPANGCTVLPPAPAAVPEETAWRGEGYFLVADDEEMVRHMAARALERCGFTVLCASNGLEAVAAVRQKHGTLRGVLLDMTMPQMNGNEALREIRAISGDLPVIMSSGYSEEEMGGEINAHERVWFLQKPYRTRDLAQLARTCAELTTGTPPEVSSS